MQGRRLLVLVGLALAAGGLVLPSLAEDSGVAVWEAMQRSTQWGVGAAIVVSAAVCLLPLRRTPGMVAAAAAAGAGVLVWVARGDAAGEPGVGYPVAVAGAVVAVAAGLWDALSGGSEPADDAALAAMSPESAEDEEGGLGVVEVTIEPAERRSGE
jgi:hypothetical protein